MNPITKSRKKEDKARRLRDEDYCPTPRKHCYLSREHAERANRRSTPDLESYACKCGAWHLATKRLP